MGITRQWLCWYDESGNWILTPIEQEQQRVQQEQQRADRLAARLRAMGVDPDAIEDADEDTD